MSVIEEAVGRIDEWRGKTITIQPLSAGLTNWDYRMEVNGTPCVVRVPGECTVHRLETVRSKNDLLAENYVDAGKQLWLIDYEYSGNNDPTFELGNTCQEMEFSDDQISEVRSAYFGIASTSMIARMVGGSFGG